MSGGRNCRQFRAVFAGENGALPLSTVCAAAGVAMRIFGKMKGTRA
ncbi:MAG: hypothetical protein HLUCCO18_05405 [Rhodobacteraceae bacterium HLUCCO18]|nr:MAG: hypothetical protein HLUCCO18_05405 [Rhodobacteraceae bacterium HLUCCO18]